MTHNYEAVVVTNDGIYRASTPDSRTIAITEDGVEGVIEYIHLHPEETSASAPASLPITLKWWVLENRRGIAILNSYLYLRG
jgi:hypothetical protein